MFEADDEPQGHHDEDVSETVQSPTGVRDGSEAAPFVVAGDEDGDADAAGAGDTISRAYQIEMFHESLRQNIIVAMDTGTGKTRIAILRMQHELSRSSDARLVWFIAPTVLLCGQQYRVISANLPAFQGKLITGESNTDAWRKDTWDAALLNVRYVVSTPDVLYGALSHAFISLESLSLLIFDEAHGCVKENRGSVIMREFYTELKLQGRPVPAILGLTASPVQDSNIQSLHTLEVTLDAVCKTPTRSRVDLARYTNRPVTLRHVCRPEPGPAPAYGPNLASLERVRYDSTPDPALLAAFASTVGVSTVGGVGSGSALDVETYKAAMAVFQSLRRKALSVFADLGPWAAEYYIFHSIRRIATLLAQRPFAQDTAPFLQFLLDKATAERPVWPTVDDPDSVRQFTDGLSPKVAMLVDILSTHRPDTSGTRSKSKGIVFVQQRAVAAVLTRIVSVHPALASSFNVGHVVGLSRNTQGDFYDALDMAPKSPTAVLQAFRANQLNLLVATSVIEEGIDVPACNLVVCVDRLTSLKAFIQRRGRARETHSEFHLLLSEDPDRAKQAKLDQEWEALEAEMKTQYDDADRVAANILSLEAGSDITTELLPPLRSRDTDARIAARDARNHLQHFCSLTSSSAHVQAQPIYLPVAVPGTDLFGAHVRLPATLPAHLRSFSSKYAWRRQADAFVDAALQSYTALYENGLLTEYLLPPQKETIRDDRLVASRPNVAKVSAPWRPWPRMLRAWRAIVDDMDQAGILYKHQMRVVADHGELLYEADLILPSPMPSPPAPFSLYTTAETVHPWTVHIGPGEPFPAHEYDDATDHTAVLLEAAYGHRWPMGDAHRLVRVRVRNEVLRMADVALAGLPRLCRDTFGPDGQPTTADMARLVRKSSGTPYVYDCYLDSKPPPSLVRKLPKDYAELPDNVPYVAVRRWPRVVGFLHRTKNAAEDGADADEEVEADDSKNETADDDKPGRKYHLVIPADELYVDRLPVAYVRLGSLLPAMNQIVEVMLVASELMSATRLRVLPVKNVSLVATALSTGHASLPTNYQTFEFLGDAVLKMLVSVNMTAQHLMAPEGWLSKYKDRHVSNERLMRAALDLGLDRYIVSKPWVLRNWNEYCVKLAAADAAADVVSSPPDESQETMSTKVLADVVEALLGAFYTDGGLPLALDALRILEDDGTWHTLDECRKLLFEAAPEHLPDAAATVAPVEQMIGYTFTKKSLLLQAMTHASYQDSACECMERFEFVGDSILDFIVVKAMSQMRPALTHQRMHGVRAAFVNGPFLGFSALTLTVAETRTVWATQEAQASFNDPNVDPNVQHVVHHRPLSAFRRHGGTADLVELQTGTQERLAGLREEIMRELWTGRVFPWRQLAELDVQKYHSDMMEAVLGAVWIDSGSLATVEAVLERIGLMPCLRRAIDEDVGLMHPVEDLYIKAMAAGVVVTLTMGGPVGPVGPADTRDVFDESGEFGESGDAQPTQPPPSDDVDMPDVPDSATARNGPGRRSVCRIALDGEFFASVHGLTNEHARILAAEMVNRGIANGTVRGKFKR